MDIFFASGFSRSAIRLLTLFSAVVLAPSEILSNQLITNNINKEKDMPPSRSEIPLKNKWNVEALYSDPSLWMKELTAVKGKEETPRWPELKSYQGKLADPKALTEFMHHYLSLDRKLSKLATYAHLRLDEDLGNDEFKRNYGLISSINHDFRMETSWLEPEILSLPDSAIQKLIKEPSLAPYRFHFERILRMRPHTLSSDKEELLALSGKALDASYKAFAALNNADMVFKPAVDSEGKEHPLTNGTYSSLIHSPDRALRRSSMLNLHLGYQSHLNTFCELLQGQTQAHLFNARARNFPNCVTSALFSNQIDPSVIDQLVHTVKKGRAVMEEYLALRKSILKLDELHPYDLSSPLVEEVDMKLTYEEARAAVIESVAPLGSEYQAALQKGLTQDRWVDPFENAKKRSGAYSSGCYDSMPYILMNFHNTLYDTTTLAHEAGHSMHSFLSRKNQPYIYAQYSLFVAEVASTFNELLLTDYLMKKVKTKKEKAYLINDQIDRIRGTIVQQTLFAEFELKIHKLVEQGQPLTPSLLNRIFVELMREYYGPLLVIDPEIEVGWSRIPHFYYDFYVYQYATGVSAAMALHAQVLSSPEGKERYLKFLSSGGSKYPLDQLKDAGVDMTTSAPIEAALKRFEYLVKELKKNLE